MSSPAPTPVARLMRRFLVAFLLGMILVLGGVGLMMATASGPTLTLGGYVGTGITSAGLVALLFAVIYGNKHDELVVEGQHDHAEQGPSDPGAIRWYPNPYREILVERQKRLRTFLVGTVLVFVAGTGLLVGLFTGVWNPPMTVGNAFIGLWFVFLTLFCVGLSVGTGGTAKYAPLRLGLSDRGVHAEYDPAARTKDVLPVWAPEYAPWSDIASLSVAISFGASHQIMINRVGGGIWSFSGLSSALMNRVRSAWDKGPNSRLT